MRTLLTLPAIVTLLACSPVSPATLPDDAGHDATRPGQFSMSVSPLQLYPTFAPEIHDYYVRCSAGVNSLHVDVTAAAGDTASITRPTASSPAAHLSVAFDLNENDAIVVNAVHENASEPYWVRCLPHDFPVLSMALHPSVGTPPQGYYLVGNTYKATGEAGDGEGGYGMVLDMNGTPIWYGKTLNNAGGKDTDLLDSNTISYVPLAGYTFGPYEGAFELHSLNPVGVKYVAAVDQPVDTHEIRVNRKGNYLLFGDKIALGVNLMSVHPDGSAPYFTTNEDAVDCTLQEITPSGELVWKWVGSEHMDFARETVQVETQVVGYVAGTGGAPPTDSGVVYVRDPFHCNAIDEDPNSDGNLIISARNTDAIFYIQHDTAHQGTSEDGKILWKLGGTPYSKDGARLFTVTGDPNGGFHRQHHVRYLPDGTLTVYDDHTSSPGPARGVQFRVDTDAGAASIFWEYDFPNGAASIGMGSFQVLADGSRVVGWGYPTGGTQIAFTEVDEQGNDLLDFSFPSTSEATYRALKFPTSAVNIQSLRESIGPWSTGNGIPPDAGVDGGHDARAGSNKLDAAPGG